MRRKRRTVEALRIQRQRTLARLGALPSPAWEAACLPGWQVRDVAAHLVAADEAAVTLRLLGPMLGSPTREAFERWNDLAALRWRDRPPDALLAALARWGRRLVRLVQATPAPLLGLPVATPYGRQSLGFLLDLRAHDEWVHEQDIAWAVQERGPEPMAAPPPLPVAEAVAETVFAVLPRLLLPRAAARAGVARLVVDLNPPGSALEVRSLVWGVDFARRQYGPRVTARAHAEVRVHAGVLGLLMESRLHWREVGAPWLLVDGDEEVAAGLLDVLPLNPGEPSASG